MSSSKSRAVDKLRTVQPRPVEMQVLCLGLSRTSTMSLCTALGKLGYKSYHMVEVFAPENRGTHLSCWHEAIRAKLLGTGKEYGREEFDKVLGNYSAVTDAPCVNFSEALIKAYPEAKVVLSLRDPDKWVPSVERSFYQVLSWPSWRLLALLDPFVGIYNELILLILKDWTGGDWENRRKLKQGFIDHNERVRSLVPKERLLEFRVEQGWKPLCKFLGKEVPDEPYPRVNEGNNAANLHIPIIYISYAKLVGKIVIWPVLVGVGAAVMNWCIRGGKFAGLDRLLRR